MGSALLRGPLTASAVWDPPNICQSLVTLEASALESYPSPQPSVFPWLSLSSTGLCFRGLHASHPKPVWIFTSGHLTTSPCSASELLCIRAGWYTGTKSHSDFHKQKELTIKGKQKVIFQGRACRIRQPSASLCSSWPSHWTTFLKGLSLSESFGLCKTFVIYTVKFYSSKYLRLLLVRT